LEKEEDIKQNISTSERTGAIIEPLPKLQWWVDVNKEFINVSDGSLTSLKEIMRKAVESGAVAMPQEGFRKSYFHWIENLRDWCISRQIWFGHRIPVWYRGDEVYCDIGAPQGEGWEQDPDVLDTWFSSALWTFSTLGWPEKTTDLETYHPNSFMLPGYEILPLWVSRMILMSGFHLGQVPFKMVMLHGLVRAKDGRKFSKSLNNGVDPLEIIEKYGADALRMGLLVGTPTGSDIKFDESKIKGYKLFANKLWNIARFVLEAAEKYGGQTSVLDMTLMDELDALTKNVTDDLDNFRFHLASEKLYHYVWDRFASEIIEESKPILAGADKAAATVRLNTLYSILNTILRLLHPFMPFVTEEIWASLPTKETDLLMIAPWPSV
jgi:valyl-tRNA synthetase